MKIVFGIIILLYSCTLSAEIFKGHIRTEKGEVIPNATLYIRERATGIAANETGDFRLLLEKGIYTFDIRSLGYEMKTVTVEINRPEQSQTFLLSETSYRLNDVLVRAKGEDPAYPIMRHAIAMAPWYLNQVKRFDSEVYLKGKLRVNKIPKLLNISISANEVSAHSKKKEKTEDITKQLFLVETHHQITFTAPDQYQNKLLAGKSSVPDAIGDKMFPSVLTGSIYDPKAYGCISPLSPNAFAYYRFSLEGVRSEGEVLINKIRVTPRKKNPELLTGYLYVIDNTWNIHQADLSMEMYGVRMQFNTAYNEVKQGFFLPTTYDIDMKINILGVRAEGKYYTSVRYAQIEVQDTPLHVGTDEHTTSLLPITESDTVERQPLLSPKQQKARQKLEVMLEKKELSNRDALKMARLMNIVTEPEEKRVARESLEEVNRGATIRTEVDSLAMHRDFLYWSGIRTLPLLTEELNSYRKRDSIAANLPADSVKNASGDSTNRAGSLFTSILTGDTRRIGTLRLHYNGLLRAVPEYNFVDGFWIGQQVRATIDFSHRRHLELSPSFYYVTARKRINWYLDGTYRYAPLHFGQLNLTLGNRTEDYNGNDGMVRFINSISSLCFAENPVRFYQNRFLGVSNRIEPVNGLTVTPMMMLAKRNALENRTGYNFQKKSPQANLLPAEYGEMPDNTALKAGVDLSYTPRQHYRITKGYKQYTRSNYPSLLLGYEQAISTGNKASASFIRVQLAVEQQIKINAFNEISYNVEAGRFFGSSRRIYFPDFKHFDTNQLFVSGRELNRSFSLIDQYEYATDRQWAQGHLNWTSEYLLLKRIPFLQAVPLSEALHLHSLQIPSVNYSEVGYSVGIEDLFRVGVFCGFRNAVYSGIGFVISIPLLQQIKY